MPASGKAKATTAERIGAELELIRLNVAGVIGSIIATSDGFLVAHDVPDLEPAQIAALVATMQAVALRTTLATGCGQFREVVTRGSDGYLAVYAAGRSAIVAVVGSGRLNVAMLNFQARRIIARIAEYSAEFERWASAQGRPDGGASSKPQGRDDAPRPLPVRRPRMP